MWLVIQCYIRNPHGISIQKLASGVPGSIRS
ncbi:hypothetical protein BDFB_005665 [Asbolus verrucosus]|uniref:Uncharacterized protein n=1 Tax=Asbolus verrucosus TaxID=1661398 RepID=A0A482V9G5_ASBVE|nr:hypothetical protein BDFB_005665 [Asbolus verrucosus]